jgi:hypothetical protein
MQAVVILGSLFRPDPALAALAERCVKALDALGGRAETLVVPFNPQGDVARQLFAVALLPLSRYDAVFVLQREGLCLGGRRVYFAEPDRPEGRFLYYPVHDGRLGAACDLQLGHGSLEDIDA